MAQRSGVVALVVVAVAGSAGIAAVLGRGGAEERESALRGEIASLRSAVADERKARTDLAREVARLRAELEALHAGAGSAAVGATADPAPERTGSRMPDSPRLRQAIAELEDGGSARSLDEAALIAGGFSASEAARLRERYENVEMERLYLRDRATREGWLSTPRFAEERRALEQRLGALRGELGDDGYDWFLYASGQFNRVVVADVLDGSPAQEAGLQRGDALVRYGDQRVFDPDELMRATSAGQAGESVRVEVLRGSDRRTVTLPRGPIGVRLFTDRVQPEAPR
ncbi:MAG TPA: PDZ domain-containing protein [Myxococcota bacterium]|jgi:hypothetical protein|nr:PDZ domain-containing protein [Myxococcota bacterium]